MAVISNNGKVTTGKVTHGTLYPRLDIELGILLRHLRHLDSQSGEHPRAIDAHEILHTKATGRRMEVGGIEHVIAQMSREEASAEVAMKRLSQKFVSSYFIHFAPFLPRTH